MLSRKGQFIVLVTPGNGTPCISRRPCFLIHDYPEGDVHLRVAILKEGVEVLWMADWKRADCVQLHVASRHTFLKEVTALPLLLTAVASSRIIQKSKT